MHAEELTRALSGRWYRSYGIARCPAHDDRNPSLSIADGDDGRLLLYCHAGCSYDAIRRASEDIWDRAAQSTPIKPRRTHNSDSGVLGPLISRLWGESRPGGGTRVEAYLRGRAISGPIPTSIRFHPSLRHPTGRNLPAMVAGVDSVNGTLAALHRTYLDPTSPKKCAIEPNKAMLGPCRGSAVRLRNEGSILVICEGIETGLSLCDTLDTNHAVWSALSASGIAGLCLPTISPERSALLIAADGDIAGRCAASTLADRASKIGWAVEVVTAPDGLDFNDLAQEDRHG